LLQRLTLRKDWPHCPITSSICLISNNSEISFAYYHDPLIVWDASKTNISNKCIVTEVKMGAGIVTSLRNSASSRPSYSCILCFFYS
jgi:hypothetical protein